METNHKQALRDNTDFQYVVENMYIEEMVLPYLIEEDIISEDQCEDIATQPSIGHETRAAKNKQLMEYIMLCDPAKKPFEQLYKALADSNQDFLIKRLKTARLEAARFNDTRKQSQYKYTSTTRESNNSMQLWCKPQTILLVVIAILLCIMIFKPTRTAIKIVPQSQMAISDRIVSQFPSLIDKLIKNSSMAKTFIEAATKTNGKGPPGPEVHNPLLNSELNTKKTRLVRVGLTKDKGQPGTQKRLQLYALPKNATAAFALLHTFPQLQWYKSFQQSYKYSKDMYEIIKTCLNNSEIPHPRSKAVFKSPSNDHMCSLFQLPCTQD